MPILSAGYNSISSYSEVGRYKTHKRHMPYMPIDTTTGSTHLITAETCDMRFGILHSDLSDQFGCMQIPGCLTC